VASGHEDPYFSAEEDPEDPRAKILTVEELENHFLEKAPDLSGTWGPSWRSSFDNMFSRVL